MLIDKHIQTISFSLSFVVLHFSNDLFFICHQIVLQSLLIEFAFALGILILYKDSCVHCGFRR